MESILNYLFAIIEPFIEQYGLLGVFIGMTIESACIPLPVKWSCHLRAI